MAAPIAIRLWRRVEERESGCWEWTGALSSGYGRIHHSPGRLVYTHRLAYELLVGPIPEGMDLDHLCRNTKCCNVAHLEPVTRQVNLLRGETLTAAHAEGRDCGFAACKNCQRFRVAS